MRTPVYLLVLIFAVGSCSGQIVPCVFSLNGHCYSYGASNVTKDEARKSCADYPGGELYTEVDGYQDRQVREWLVRDGRKQTFWVDASRKVVDWHWSATGGRVVGQGCWLDSTAQRDLDAKFVHYPLQNFISYNFTVSTCVDKCRMEGTRYAGAQAGQFCYCGDSYGKYKRGGTCNEPCIGDRNQMCGGGFRNYVLLLDGQFANWIPGKPAANGSCAIVNPYEHYKWEDRICSDKQNAICRADRKATSDYICYSDDNQRTSYCFLYLVQRLTWFEARQTCKERGGMLAYVSKRENYNFVNFIAQAFRKYNTYRNKSEYVWIGLTNSLYEWSKSREEIKTNIRWLPREPQGVELSNGVLEFSGREERCVYMSEKNGQYGWSTNSCGRTAIPLCKYPKSIPAQTTTPLPITTAAIHTTTASSAAVTSRPQVTTTTSKAGGRPKPLTKSPSGGNNTTEAPSPWTQTKLITYIGIGAGILALIVFVIALIMCLVLTKRQNERRRKAEPGVMINSYEIDHSAYEHRLVEGKEGTPPSSNLGISPVDQHEPSPPPRSTSLDQPYDDNERDGTPPMPLNNSFTPMSVTNDQYYVNHEPGRDDQVSPQPYYQNTTEAYGRSVF